MTSMNKLNLYTPDGWVNIPAVLDYQRERDLPFAFVYGGRGIGKTYGALLEARGRAVNGQGKFMLVRRTQAQVDIIGKPELSPFKPIDVDTGCSTICRPVAKYVSGFYNEENHLIGYAAALSTFSNMRGFDASDVELIIFDEFIPERHERPIKNECDALLNLYETINRNRELSGRPPALMICLANANHLDNPIFTGLGLVNIAVKMGQKHRQQWSIPERGILLINIDNSPVSQAKSSTALYRLARGTKFSDMAIGNQFNSDTGSRYGRIPINECKALLTVGRLTVYEHKTGEYFYICQHQSGTPAEEYADNDTDLQRFKSRNIWLWREYMNRNIIFIDRESESLFDRYFHV